MQQSRRGFILAHGSVPDSSRTPKESAIISKKYLEEKLGMKV